MGAENIKLIQDTCTINTSYLRKEAVDAINKLKLVGIKQVDELDVIELKEALILPGRKVDNGPELGLGGVIDKDGKYINFSKNSGYFGGKYSANEVLYSEEVVVYCGFCEGHWGHFLIDIVSRLWYVLETKVKVDEYIIIDYEGRTNNWLKGSIAEFLELLGILDKVRIQTIPVKYKKVIIPQYAYDYDSCVSLENKNRYYSQKYLKTIQYVSEKVINNFRIDNFINYEKIFFTRSALPQNSDCGIEVLDEFFKRNGFKVISPEKLTLREQIYLINNCEKFACISGSLQHNVLFSVNPIDSIIVRRHPYINTIELDISIMKGNKVTYIDAYECLYPVHISFGPFVYAYNSYFEKYIKDNNFIPPIDLYRTKYYMREVFLEYLKKYSLPTNGFWKENISVGVYEAALEGMNNASEIVDLQIIKNKKNYIEPEIVHDVVLKTLLQNNIPYSKWSGIDIYNSFVELIKKNYDKKRFLIYPFGRNGSLFKNILNIQFGILEECIFDNFLCNYNSKIRHIEEIKNYLYEDICVVLTSASIDCWKDLLSVCDIKYIQSPYLLI